MNQVKRKKSFEKFSNLAVPVLETETVTGNLPDGLLGVGRRLCCEKEVLVEETLLVALEFNDSTGHHQYGGLALSSLFVNGLAVQGVNLELA